MSKLCLDFGKQPTKKCASQQETAALSGLACGACRLAARARRSARRKYLVNNNKRERDNRTRNNKSALAAIYKHKGQLSSFFALMQQNMRQNLISIKFKML
jgi:hypothetical protein